MIPLRRPAVLLAGLLGASLLLGPAARLAVAADPASDAARREITPNDARAVARVLAGPAFYGRGTGQKGNEEAAKWLASELRKAGWDPGPVPDREESDPRGRVKKVEGDFLQWFDLPAPRVRKGASPRTANVVGVLRGTGFPAGGTATPTGPPAADGEGGSPPDGEPAGEALPATAREAVVLGAHFDHLGIPNYDPDDRKPPRKSSVFWGADDNASGTTAVLLIARALGRLAEDGVRPRRTVVLCFFTGEEAGLLGSEHYCREPVVPLADTVAMLNLDMVGRNDTKTMEVYGNMSSPELDAYHKEALEVSGMNCTYPPPIYLNRSDQWPFYQAKIPVMFFFAGMHNDYHSTRDTADRLNFPKIALIARHTFEVLWRVANDPVRPTFNPVDLRGAGGRLGVAVVPCSQEERDRLGLEEEHSAVRVVTVFAGSLGEKLFEPGDLLYSWAGFPLYADDPVGRFTAFANAARQGDTVVVRLLRGKERMAASVKF